MAEMQLAFPGELYSVDTISDPLFKFLALHFTWYNKFSESVSILFQSFIVLRPNYISRGLEPHSTYTQASFSEKVLGRLTGASVSLGNLNKYATIQAYTSRWGISWKTF